MRNVYELKMRKQEREFGRSRYIVEATKFAKRLSDEIHVAFQKAQRLDEIVIYLKSSHSEKCSPSCWTCNFLKRVEKING